MSGRVLMLCLTLAAALGASASRPGQAVQPYDLQQGRSVSLAEALSRIRPGHIILVGESHTEARHHDLQLTVIQALVDTGHRVAVGLEMFRRDSQDALDAWIAGRLPESAFTPVFADNWNYPWDLYRPILVYARDRGLPLIGLNVPREITRQVARGGFASLTPAQRARLPVTTCEVSDSYRGFIRDAHGAHGHGSLQFDHFCEAQLVWDQSMAMAALEHLAAAPESVVVILAGTGHARKGGIPAQIARRGKTPHTVFLPLVPGSLDPQALDAAEADYLLPPRRD